MEDIPDNSHFHFDGVISFSALHATGHVTITKAINKNTVFNQLKIAQKIDPRNQKGGRIIFTLNFFSDGKSKNIELMNSLQDGFIIYAGFQFYRSDRLWTITKSYFLNKN
jgi:hypothetical protein